MDELKRKVIDFEKARFLEATHLDGLRPGCSMEFTEVGRYDELLGHIREHKWYINLKKTEEIPFEQAAVSWYDTVYFPIIADRPRNGAAGPLPARPPRRTCTCSWASTGAS